MQKLIDMQFIVFLLLYPILWLLSILPFRLLYVVSDGVYVLIYYVVGYRKKIVRQNIALALPHLSAKERLQVEKMTISEKEIDKRFVFTNLELYQNMEKEGKSIALMCAHYASYEWVISMNRHITFEGFAIYKKIANQYFDKLVRDIRSKFKATLITNKQTIPTIERNSRNHHLGVYGFASDQSPQLSKTHHWATFMGIETPVHTGAEMLAKRFDMNVVFLRVRKVKRGHYEASFEHLADTVKTIPNYQISDAFLKRVETQILEAPEYYLWTHKRWKHSKV